jgi:hypothetical protein
MLRSLADKFMDSGLVKVFFDLKDTDWKWQEESMWALPTKSSDEFILDNIPLLTYGISQGDKFSTHIANNNLFFKEILERGGHSTFRINFKVIPTEFQLKKYLDDIISMGCSYEGNGATLYAIDAPSNDSQEKLLVLLKNGEVNNVWDYEEGYVSNEET